MICRLFVFFMIFSVFGWIFETVYGMLYTGKWENRGFLYGPICPIYGTGAVGIIVVYEMLGKITGGYNLKWWQIFIIAFVGSFILEYATSYLLEKKFHAKWWDYSNLPLNINGRICVPASCLFGMAGLFVIYIVYPFTTRLNGMIPPFIMEICALLLMMIGAIDATLTISALTDFEKYIVEVSDAIDEHMEVFMENLQERKEESAKKIEEERERFTLEYAKHRLSGIGKIHLKATLRVKSFLYKVPDAMRANKYIEQAKEFISKGFK
ncbi:MAG: putative ABC transporter permease [Eubacterium sp.]|nr:putative ABC transporter permease [Eubacterium sp.]